MTFDSFVDWYGTWGLRAAGFVVGVYIAFISTVIFRYFQGVWRGKWPLENCVGIGIGGIGKSIFLGGFCFLVIGGIAFIGWPIVIPLSVVVVLHPDFRKNCGEKYLYMNKRSAVRYIFVAVPLLCMSLAAIILEAADEMLEDES